MRLPALSAALLTVFGAALVSSAGASREENLRIRLAQGIGKIRLGMTEPALRRAMGRPQTVTRRSAGFGRQTIEYEYAYGGYRARLYGSPGRLRVVRASTVLRRERTPQGVGPGTLEQRLRRTYPRLRCQRLPTVVAAGAPYVTVDERTCMLFTASGRRTAFVTGVPRNATFVLVRDWNRLARVLEVSVGEPR